MNLEVGKAVTRIDNGQRIVPIRRVDLPADVVVQVNVDAFLSEADAERFAKMFILSHTKLTHLPNNGVGDEIVMGGLQQCDDYNLMKSIYGDRIDDKRYQALRLLEEVFELLQTLGSIISKADVDRAWSWVHTRTAGKTTIELGDVQLSLNVFAMVVYQSVAKCREIVIGLIKKNRPADMVAKDDQKKEFGL
jgi:hypothetical protein